MKKKITALILVVPLIFMFTVFSAGQAAAITVPVSVNNVVIDNKPKGDVLQIDMGDYDPFVIKVDIQPASASNQKFTITSSDETVAT
ncbi:MAG: hypothetical protein IKD26_02495, partial [Clostridia bacterium]|nr:hypothetical protein [Clostridia bacterium]